jgi:hypothetical protein
MFGEPWDGLLVGGSLTLVTSVVILILTNSSAERQWLMQRTLEDESRAVEQVYSPLYFTLWDLFVNCGFLSGLISASLEQYQIRPIEKSPPSWLEEYHCERKLSRDFREILIDKLGLIYPIGLRDDIFYFFKHVESFESDLFYLVDDNAQTIERKLGLYTWVADFTAAIGMSLAETVKKLIDLKGKQMKEEDYRQIFDAKVTAELQEFLSKEASPELVKEFKEWAKNQGKTLNS